MALPNFLIIGAQKCGTTWLHYHLRQHPQIFMPVAKEQSFFCWRSGPYAYPLAEYEAHFAACHLPRCGESTAAYLWTNSGSIWDQKPAGYEADIPARVYRMLGAETRLIVTLRNPVQRAISAYFHHLAWGAILPHQSLLAVGHLLGIIAIGFYAAHLRNWLAVFPPENFLVLSLEEDIQAQPQAALYRCYQHLGVPLPATLPVDIQARQYPGIARIFAQQAWWTLKPAVATPPLEITPETLTRDYDCRVDTATIAQLEAIYAEDQQQLRQLLRGVFNQWKSFP